ncbi:Transcriptional activator protein DAL81 [Paramyrothecium foliicola]|nr:Transcriptional activator protein DAL81 [Paramyrothecium foliicola]
MIRQTTAGRNVASAGSNASLSPPEQSGSPPGRPQPAPRTRPCDTCRLRKTRCVRKEGQQRCVLCSFHGQPCTFLRGPPPRHQGPHQSQHPRRQSQVRDDVAFASHEVPDTPYQWPTSETTHRSLFSSQHHGQNQSTEQHSPVGALPVPTLQGNMMGSIDAARPEILNDTLGLDLKTHAEYIGPTDFRDPILLDLHRPPPRTPENGASSRISGFARRLDDSTIFLVQPDEIVASEAQRIADLDAIEALVQPLGRTLVDLYFRIVHPSFPILHKDVFISKHQVSYRHFAPSLLAAVYLLALDWQLYDSSLAGRDTQNIPDASALETIAERTISQDMRRPKLSTLEAGLLLLQRNHLKAGSSSIKNMTSSRTFTAQIVAMAQDLGIHIDCSTWSIPRWEIGLRRRLAWALYMQDRWGAFVHGRPLLIQDCDWDVEQCSALDFPELSTSEEPYTEDSDVDASLGWQLFLHHAELAQMLSDILTTFYTPAATRKGGTLDRLGVVAVVERAKPLILRLRQWHAGLPGDLQLASPQTRKLCANASLHLAHASAEILLHRALVRTLTPDAPDGLRDAIRSAARSKLQEAVELLGSLKPEHTAAFWGSAAAHQAAQIGTLAALLWATAESTEEMAWCASQVEELRWALRVRGAAASFAREALRLLERDIGGVGVVRTVANNSG